MDARLVAIVSIVCAILVLSLADARGALPLPDPLDPLRQRAPPRAIPCLAPSGRMFLA